MEAQVDVEQEPFKVPAEEIDELLNGIRKSKRVRPKYSTISSIKPLSP